MNQVAVVIPNYNGIQYIRDCLEALRKQTCRQITVLVVDNGSTDGSDRVVEKEYQEVKLLRLDRNYGFCRAVNEGIRQTEEPYIILLNNDTQADCRFVEALLEAAAESEQIFSCSARMMQYHNRTQIDDAGDYYCALGWAFARGKGKKAERFLKKAPVFACCAGAAIYKRTVLEKIGLFDEAHFAYLEDIDIGYRARIEGYQNLYVPEAVVYHIGSATSGSRYNEFKVRLAARNSIYLIYKNMPFFQIILNLPFLTAGFFVKILFFMKNGFGKEYVCGLLEGFTQSRHTKKVKFQFRNLANYLKIQGQLWFNLLRRGMDF